jgi:hypothetical protein
LSWVIDFIILGFDSRRLHPSEVSLGKSMSRSRFQVALESICGFDISQSEVSTDSPWSKLACIFTSACIMGGQSLPEIGRVPDVSGFGVSDALYDVGIIHFPLPGRNSVKIIAAGKASPVPGANPFDIGLVIVCLCGEYLEQSRKTQDIWLVSLTIRLSGFAAAGVRPAGTFNTQEGDEHCPDGR